MDESASVQLAPKPQLLNEAVLVAGALIFALGFAYFGSGYQLHKATSILAYTIAVLSLNFLSGYNGQVSLGHGAFLAIGAYTTAILMARFGVPFWLAIPLGGCVSMAIGFLIGFPALR